MKVLESKVVVGFEEEEVTYLLSLMKSRMLDLEYRKLYGWQSNSTSKCEDELAKLRLMMKSIKSLS